MKTFTGFYKIKDVFSLPLKKVLKNSSWVLFSRRVPQGNSQGWFSITILRLFSETASRDCSQRLFSKTILKSNYQEQFQFSRLFSRGPKLVRHKVGAEVHGPHRVDYHDNDFALMWPVSNRRAPRTFGCNFVFDELGPQGIFQTPFSGTAFKN